MGCDSFVFGHKSLVVLPPFPVLVGWNNSNMAGRYFDKLPLGRCTTISVMFILPAQAFRLAGCTLSILLPPFVASPMRFGAAAFAIALARLEVALTWRILQPGE